MKSHKRCTLSLNQTLILENWESHSQFQSHFFPSEISFLFSTLNFSTKTLILILDSQKFPWKVSFSISTYILYSQKSGPYFSAWSKATKGVMTFLYWNRPLLKMLFFPLMKMSFACFRFRGPSEKGRMEGPPPSRVPPKDTASHQRLIRPRTGSS